MNRIHRMLVVALCLSLPMAVGCGEKQFPIAPVSGKVTLNGKPLAGAKLKFQPVAKAKDIEVGGGSYGMTDDQGSFTLMLILQEGPGAVVGEHRVTITTGQAAADTDQSTITGEKVPKKWREGTETFTVPPGGTDQANFEVGE